MYNENYDYDSQGNLWRKGTAGSEAVYTYLDSNHKHAVTHLGGAPMYSYDPNGNMTMRTVGSTTYTQGWDAENRLVSVSGTGLSASFSYDGDGARVKGTVNVKGEVTAYVGNWFEWAGSTSTMKKYYYYMCSLTWCPFCGVKPNSAFKEIFSLRLLRSCLLVNYILSYVFDV